MDGPIGLDYNAVFAVAQASGFTVDGRILERIRVLEQALLERMRKKS